MLHVHAVYTCANKLLHAGFPLTLCSDTLLNVFLAIAVDNLANAQELTKVHYNPILRNISVPFIFWALIIVKSYAPLLNDFRLFSTFALFLPLSSLAFDSLLISLSAGWTGGRGGCQSENRPAESQGGCWSQPTLRCQPLHCSVSFCLFYCFTLICVSIYKHLHTRQEFRA